MTCAGCKTRARTAAAADDVVGPCGGCAKVSRDDGVCTRFVGVCAAYVSVTWWPGDRRGPPTKASRRRHTRWPRRRHTATPTRSVHAAEVGGGGEIKLTSHGTASSSSSAHFYGLFLRASAERKKKKTNNVARVNDIYRWREMIMKNGERRRERWRETTRHRGVEIKPHPWHNFRHPAAPVLFIIIIIAAAAAASPLSLASSSLNPQDRLLTLVLVFTPPPPPPPLPQSHPLSAARLCILLRATHWPTQQSPPPPPPT